MRSRLEWQISLELCNEVDGFTMKAILLSDQQHTQGCDNVYCVSNVSFTLIISIETY